MDAIKGLFGLFIVVLLVSVIGIALRETIVGQMCAMSSDYSITLPNGSSQSFDGSGISCATNGLLYTWGLVLVGLGALVGLIFTAVKSFKG
jgi:hypothetical protein